ncbi:MAG: hypothetical protein QME32_02495, partial [Endomicrobiia bacterium]|nr:hypothetical protein [Endomicrobiia bacterium]
DQYDSYPQSGYTITFDTTPPVAAIQIPIHNGFYSVVNALPNISGTATDPLPFAGASRSDIDYARVAIREIGGDWWNGVSFSSSSISWRSTVKSGGPAWTWEYPAGQGAENLPSWQDNKKYAVWTEAFDKSGNAGGVVISSFTYDTMPPTSKIQLPANAYHKSGELATLSGTASDGANANRSDLERVEIAIQRDPESAGNYWSWGAQTFSLPTSSYTSTNAGTLANWQQTSNLPTWDNFDGITFRVFANAKDKSQNYQSAVTTFTFIYDITPPTVKVHLPSSDSTLRYSSLPTITGTAADAAPGALERVEARIRNNSASAYWNTSTLAFDISDAQAATAWFTAQTTMSYQTWFTTFTAGSNDRWTDTITYRVESRSLDKAGIFSPVYSTATFTYDKTPPTSQATLPSDRSIVRELSTISGTSADTAGGTVSQVRVAVRRNTDGKWFDGSDFTQSDIAPLFTDWVAGFTGTRWQYTTLTDGKLTSGVSYYVTSESRDNAIATNIEQWAARGSTFTFDNSNATTTVILPAHNLFYNALSQIQGTARDATSPIDKVETAVQRLTDGRWWNPAAGGSWDDTGANPVWLDVSTASLADWTLYSSSMPSSTVMTQGARYNVTARSSDRPGNVEALFSVGVNSVTFTWDVGKPTSTITAPVNNEYYGGPARALAQIEGTAVDYPAGVSNVKWAMGEAPTGPWWNQSQSTFNAPAIVWYNASGLTSWTASTPPLKNSKQYLVRSKALDAATNEEVPSAGKTFTYDNERPASNIVRPLNNLSYNALASISGTASDNTANDKIMVSVREVGGNWYNSETGAFTVGTEEASWFASSGTATNWYYYSIPWASAKEYLVRSKAIDRATNEEIPAAGNQFKFDSAPPTSAATYPEAGVYYSAIPSITGTAADTGGSGVQRAEVRIKNVTENSFWNGSSFVGQSSWVPVAMHVSTWSYTTAVSWASGRVYQITSRAWDVAGSSETPAEIPDAGDAEFYFDDTKPATLVQRPVGGDFYKTLTVISGTASDPIASGGAVASGVETSGVEYALQNKTLGKWWSGSAFNDDNRQWFTAAGEASWQFTFSDINWDDASVYLVNSRARDKAVGPNYETAFTVDVNSVTFIVDKSTPVSLLKHPSAGLVTNILPTLSGTALDVNTPSSGIDKVEAALRRDAPSPVKWWDGSDFTADVSSYVLTQVLGPNNTYWWYTGFDSKLVTHSTYTVFARAYDKSKPSGNYEITGG